MKFLSVILCFAFIGSVALADNTMSVPKHKKVKRIVYEDDSSVTVSAREPRVVDSERVIRRITPQAGLVISDTTIKTTGTRTGFTLGGTMDLLGKNDWVLETGVFYRQQGTSNTPQGGVTSTIGLNYLSFPIAAKYYMSGQGASGMFFKGGLIPAFAISRSVSTDGAGSQDAGDTWGSFDVGAILGVGGKFNLSESASLVVEANYIRGLANIMSKDVGVSVNTVSFGIMSGVAIEM